MAEQSERIGQQVGDYRLVSYVGGGNFGGVYLGEHIRTGEQAAIKVLRTHLTSSDEIKGFLNEARTMRLRHPHIVPILDFGIDDEEMPYLVMEYAPNGTVRTRHPKGTRVPLALIVSYTTQLAAALQYAHNMQIVHRDVKPENMLLGAKGEVLLSDFGIASVAHNTRSEVSQDSFGGTIAYMAPEQASGRARPASDQYALAICVYEWLTGMRPFQGTVMEVAVQHRLAPPPPLRERLPEISAAVEQIILKALEKEPRQRFASIEAFAQALEQVSLQAVPPHTPMHSKTLPSERALRPHLNASKYQIPTPPRPPISGGQPSSPPPPPSMGSGQPIVRAQEPSAEAQLSWYVPETPRSPLTPFAHNEEYRPQLPVVERSSQASQYAQPLQQGEWHSELPLYGSTMLSGPRNQPLNQRESRRRSPVVVVALIWLVILLVGGTIGGIFFARQLNANRGQGTATATSRATRTPDDYATAIARNGSMFGFDSQHTHTNSYEHTLSVSTVGSLKNNWTFATGDAIGAAPVMANGLVYVGSKDGRLYAINAATGQLKWSYATKGAILSSPAIANGLVYVGSDDTTLYALDATTGQPDWTFPTNDVINSSPVVVNGTVYVGSYDAHLYAIDATTGRQKWDYTADSALYSSPAVADGVVYVGSSKGEFYAVDAITSNKKWAVKLSSDIYSSPAVVKGVVYIGAGDARLYALDAASGKTNWSFATDEQVKSSPAAANGLVYFGSNDGNLYAINVGTGQRQWSYATGNAITSSPTVANGLVYIGSTDHSLYALDATTGKKLWAYGTDGAIYSSPAVAEGAVYVGSDDGKLYDFSL